MLFLFHALTVVAAFLVRYPRYEAVTQPFILDHEPLDMEKAIRSLQEEVRGWIQSLQRNPLDLVVAFEVMMRGRQLNSQLATLTEFTLLLNVQSRLANLPADPVQRLAEINIMIDLMMANFPVPLQRNGPEGVHLYQFIRSPVRYGEPLEWAQMIFRYVRPIRYATVEIAMISGRPRGAVNTSQRLNYEPMVRRAMNQERVILLLVEMHYHLSSVIEVAPKYDALPVLVAQVRAQWSFMHHADLQEQLLHLSRNQNIAIDFELADDISLLKAMMACAPSFRKLGNESFLDRLREKIALIELEQETKRLAIEKSLIEADSNKKSAKGKKSRALCNKSKQKKQTQTQTQRTKTEVVKKEEVKAEVAEEEEEEEMDAEYAHSDEETEDSGVQVEIPFNAEDWRPSPVWRAAAAVYLAQHCRITRLLPLRQQIYPHGVPSNFTWEMLRDPADSELEFCIQITMERNQTVLQSYRFIPDLPTAYEVLSSRLGSIDRNLLAFLLGLSPERQATTEIHLTNGLLSEKTAQANLIILGVHRLCQLSPFAHTKRGSLAGLCKRVAVIRKPIAHPRGYRLEWITKLMQIVKDNLN